MEKIGDIQYREKLARVDKYCLEELRKNFTRFMLQPPDIFVKMFFYDGGRAWRDEENKMKFN
jgi:hypothetical protein